MARRGIFGLDAGGVKGIGRYLDAAKKVREAVNKKIYWKRALGGVLLPAREIPYLSI